MAARGGGGGGANGNAGHGKEEGAKGSTEAFSMHVLMFVAKFVHFAPFHSCQIFRYSLCIRGAS